MTETEEKRLEAIQEAVVIVHALNELILRIESERTEQNEELTKNTIIYLRHIRRKYYQLTKTPMTIIDGHIVPIINADDQVSGK